MLLTPNHMQTFLLLIGIFYALFFISCYRRSKNKLESKKSEYDNFNERVKAIERNIVDYYRHCWHLYNVGDIKSYLEWIEILEDEVKKGETVLMDYESKNNLKTEYKTAND